MHQSEYQFSGITYDNLKPPARNYFNNVYKTSSREADLFEDSTVANNCYHLRDEGDNYKIYSFVGIFELCNFITQCPARLRTFHEMRRDDSPIKAHLDVDMGRDGDYSETEVRDALIPAVRNAMLLYTIAEGRVDRLAYPQILIFSSHGANKISFHVIIDGVALLGMGECAHFARHVADELPRDIVAAIDMNIYKKGNFRAPLCVKSSDRARALRLDGAYSLGSLDMNSKREGIAYESGLTTFTANSLLYKCAAGCNQARETKNIKSDSGITLDCASYSQKDIIESCGDLLYGFNLGNVKKTDKSIYLYREKNSNCKIHNREHTSNNAILYFNPDGVVFKCLAHENLPGVFIKIAAAEKRKRPTKLERIRARNNYQKRMMYKPDPSPRMTPTETINKAELSAADIGKCRRIAIQSPMGSAKTNSVIDHITANNIKSVLLISFRRSFTGEMIQRYNAGGIPLVNYQDIRGEIDPAKYPYLVCQVESINRLVTRAKYQLVIIDECTSVFQQRYSTTMRGVSLRDTDYILGYFMRHSAQTILFDAFISKNAFECYKDMCESSQLADLHYLDPPAPPEWRCVDNIGRRATNKQTHFIHDEDKWLEDLYAAAMSKRIAVITTNDYTKMNAIRQEIVAKTQINAHDIAIYANHEDSNDHGELRDVNKNWRKYKIVMFNSVITAGVSFTREYFDEIFVRWSKAEIDVRTRLQMTNRIRSFNKLVVCDCTIQRGQTLPVDHDEITRDVNNMREMLTSAPERCNIRQYNADCAELEMDFAGRDYIRYLSDMNAGRNWSQWIEVAYYRDCGYEISFEEDICADDHVNTVKSLVAAQKAIDCEKVSAAEDIDKDTYKDLLAKSRADSLAPGENAAIQKRYLRDYYKYSGEITPRFVQTYSKQDTKRKFARSYWLKHTTQELVDEQAAQIRDTPNDELNKINWAKMAADRSLLMLFGMLEFDPKDAIADTKKEIPADKLEGILKRWFSEIKPRYELLTEANRPNRANPGDLNKIVRATNVIMQRMIGISIKSKRSRSKTIYILVYSSDLFSLYDEKDNIPAVLNKTTVIHQDIPCEIDINAINLEIYTELNKNRN